MGTWGMGTFDDDGASDWVWELEEATDSGNVATIAAALSGSRNAAHDLRAA